MAAARWPTAIRPEEPIERRYTDPMAAPLFAVTQAPLRLDALLQAVAQPGGSRAAVGAVAAFLGVVRGETGGRAVLRLEYEAHEPLAVKAFERIAAEAREHWPAAHLALHHRLGTLAVGEASVAIAACSAHRAESFAACRYAIERVKQIAPIWKHEFFEDGDAWIEGAPADPDDSGAREDAYRRACA